jgi:predicted MFS family arabinose efflux permease
MGVGLSESAASFLLAFFTVGFFAVATQVLVPFAASLAPDKGRGRAIGNVIVGLLGGIMLAQPCRPDPTRSRM